MEQLPSFTPFSNHLSAQSKVWTISSSREWPLDADVHLSLVFYVPPCISVVWKRVSRLSQCQLKSSQPEILNLPTMDPIWGVNLTLNEQGYCRGTCRVIGFSHCDTSVLDTEWQVQWWGQKLMGSVCRSLCDSSSSIYKTEKTWKYCDSLHTVSSLLSSASPGTKTICAKLKILSKQMHIQGNKVVTRTTPKDARQSKEMTARLCLCCYLLLPVPWLESETYCTAEPTPVWRCH